MPGSESKKRVPYSRKPRDMSLVVRPYNTGLSQDYLQSALDALRWVDDHPEAPNLFSETTEY